MSQPENFASFFSENKKLVTEYLETRISLLRLQSLRILSNTGGILLWAIVAVLFAFLIMVFGGLVLGLWFSELTGSYVKGFGLATLVFVVLFGLITVLRKALIINPITRKIISAADKQ